jgi:hypothetical protein
LKDYFNMAMMNGSRELLPFRRNTRQRIRQVQAPQTISGLGAQINYQLDRVGLLNYLVVLGRFTVTLSAAGAFATLGPWSIFNRIRVDLNLGNMNLVDISGYQLYQINKMLVRAWAPDGGGMYTPSALTFAAPVAMGANTWLIPLIIPISANPGSQFDNGLINLQAPEVQVNVQFRIAGAGADFVTNFTSVTGTVELYSCYFELPDPTRVALPPGQVVRTVEFSQPYAATGDVQYTLDRQGTLLQLSSTILANGARSNALDGIRLVANINDTIYSLSPIFIAALIDEFYQSCPKDVGVFNLDLWHAGEDPSSYDDRDVIDTEVLTTLQWIATVTAGTTLGAGNNFFNTARRILVNFAVPTIGPAL